MRTARSAKAQNLLGLADALELALVGLDRLDLLLGTELVHDLAQLLFTRGLQSSAGEGHDEKAEVALEGLDRVELVTLSSASST